MAIEDLDCYPKYLVRNYRERPDMVAVRRKDYGIWNNYTWRDCYQRVKYLSLGLISLGLKPGEKVAMIGDEEPEGYHAILAVQAARGLIVPLYSDSHMDELVYLVGHSDARFVVAEDQEQADKFLAIKDKLPQLEKVICWDMREMRWYTDPILLSYTKVLEMGEKYEQEHPGSFEENVSQIKSDDVAQLTYTSGTTGVPKGSMITNRVMMHAARVWQERFPLKEGENVICTLPAGSIFEQWFSSLNYVHRCVMCFPEEPETLTEDLREIAPVIMLLGPRQWLSLKTTTQVKVSDAGWLKRTFFDLGMRVGYQVFDLKAARKGVNPWWKMMHYLAEWAVFRPTRDKLGLLCTRYPLTGSTFISPDVLRFFHALGVRISQLYGSTEGGILVCHSYEDINIDTIGKPTEGVEYELGVDGELLIKASCPSLFSGYYKREDATAQRVKEGWFCTGDSVTCTPEGHIVYIERCEDLRQLRGSRKYAPGYIEGRLKFSPYIEEAIVLGDEKKDYCAVIVIINFEAVGKWAEDHHVGYTTFPDLSQKDEISQLIRSEIERVNRYLPEESKIRKYVMLHKQFDADDAELTRLRKLRRKFIEEHYQDIIDAVYQDKDEIPVVADVKYRDGRMGKIETCLKVRTI
ncbi:MAG: AMP-binding protein [Chloroflexota bacterium]